MTSRAFASMSLLLLVALLLAGGAARAQALRLPPQPAAAFTPLIGTQLPLDVMVRDEHGGAIRLGALFGRVPVVLVPGYYTCPNLCGTLFTGVLQALAMSGLAAGTYRLVGISIEPRGLVCAGRGNLCCRLRKASRAVGKSLRRKRGGPLSGPAALRRRGRCGPRRQGDDQRRPVR